MTVVPSNFSVAPAWRDSVFARLVGVGVQVTRPEFDAAQQLIDRDLERRVAAMSFGDSAAFRRTISYDSQLGRAMEMLRNAGTQSELLAAATQVRPRSE